MPKEPTNSQVLQEIQKLSGSFQTLSGSVDTRLADVHQAVQNLSGSVDSRFTEVHEAIHVFAESVDQRFGAIDKRFDSVDQRFGAIEQRFDSMVTKDYLEKRLNQMQVQMVTKDYLDTKLANLEGNLIVLTRKEDQKLHTLVGILHDKHVIDDADVRRVERLEPFAR